MKLKTIKQYTQQFLCSILSVTHNIDKHCNAERAGYGPEALLKNIQFSQDTESNNRQLAIDNFEQIINLFVGTSFETRAKWLLQ